MIVGAQKSSTTSVQAALARHPDVYLPPGEQPNLEDPDFRQDGIESLERLLGGRSERVLGIKRPTYLSKPEVPPRIRRFLPSARLIAILRNPYTRLVSAYYHYVASGFWPPMSLQTGLELLIKNVGAENATWPRAPEILENGLYADHLERYVRHGLLNNLLVLKAEGLSANWSNAARKIAAHLEIDSAPLDKHPLPRRHARSPSMARSALEGRLARFGYSYFDDGRRLAWPERSVKTLHRRFILKFGIPTARRWPQITKGSTQQELEGLSDSLKDSLHQIYSPQIARLASLVEIDTRNWTIT